MHNGITYGRPWGDVQVDARSSTIGVVPSSGENIVLHMTIGRVASWFKHKVVTP